MADKATLDLIQNEANRVYGSRHYVKFEDNGSRGVSVTVGLSSTGPQINQVCCESWYPQQALDAALAALRALPSTGR